MKADSILICGGGIAGSTLAYWLGAAGHDVTVVEKSSGARSSGNPVDVRGDATPVVRAMGVWPRLEAAATGVERVVFVDESGRSRAALSTRRQSRAEDEIELSRSELADALLDAARERAHVVFDESIAALDDDGSGVDVEFERMPARRFDLVIGADGLHSRVRRLVFGPESDFARPFGMFIATVRMPVRLDDPTEVRVHNQPGRSLALHPAGGRPGVAFIFRSREPWDGHDSAAGLALVERAYAGDGWLAPQALTAVRESDDVYFDAITRIAMGRWSRGRIALLGDAASCVSLFGEGSSNAIAGAKTLADALTAHPGAYATAFSEYENTHRRRLARFQRGAKLASHLLVPATGSGIALRNAAIRMLSRLPARG